MDGVSGNIMYTNKSVFMYHYFAGNDLYSNSLD